MDLDEARAIVAEQHRGVLGTRRLDGGVQMSPVLATVDEAGRVIISSRRTAYKVKNLLRNPKVSLCVMPDDFFGRWAQVDGTASVVELPEAMDPLVDYYRRATGQEHPDWDDYRAAMEREQRVLVRIDITRAGPDRSG